MTWNSPRKPAWPAIRATEKVVCFNRSDTTTTLSRCQSDGRRHIGHAACIVAYVWCADIGWTVRVKMRRVSRRVFDQPPKCPRSRCSRRTWCCRRPRSRGLAAERRRQSPDRTCRRRSILATARNRKWPASKERSTTSTWCFQKLVTNATAPSSVNATSSANLSLIEGLVRCIGARYIYDTHPRFRHGMQVDRIKEDDVE